MDRKKYEFTGETRALSSTTILHRIRAVIDIPSAGVNAGDIGGWIESDSNLSHRGDAWVDGNAWVCGDARVDGDARVSGNAWVCGDARVSGNAWVDGNARVGGNAWVDGDARVGGDAWVGGYARVSGYAMVDGNAHINSNKDFIIIGPIGSRSEFTTFHKNVDGIVCVRCGCFSGTVDEFLEAVQETHGDNRFGREYRIAAELAKAHILEED